MTRKRWWVLAGVTLVGALVRFGALDLQSFHHDEAVTAVKVLDPNLFQTLGNVVDGERSPFGFYAVLWPFYKLFGDGEVALRLVSALAGTLAIPLAFYAAQALRNARTGLVAAALFALNPYLIWYSQEARSYMLAVMLATLALAAFAASLRDPEDRRAPIVWALAAALAVATHYFAVFVVLPMAWILVRQRIGQARKVTAVVAVAAVVLALVPLALTQQGSGRRDGFTSTPIVERVAEAGLGYAASEEPDPLAGSRAIDAIQIGAGALALALFALAVFLALGRGSAAERRTAGRIGAVAATTAVVPVAAAYLGQDFVDPRNLIFALPPLLLLMALAFAPRRTGRIGIAATTLSLALFAAIGLAVVASSQMQRQDWRGIADELRDVPSRTLLVAPKNGDDPFAYYLGARKLKRPSERVRTSAIYAVSSNYAVTAPPGFRLVDKRGHAPVFVIWRFASRKPRDVRVGELDGDRVLHERSQVLAFGPDT